MKLHKLNINKFLSRFAYCCFFVLIGFVSAKSETVQTDYGNYQIKTTTIQNRDFLSVSSIGKIVLGSDAMPDRYKVTSDKASLQFLPGSFFFRYKESGIDRTMQMLYPAIRDLSNSEELLIPFEEFGLALSGNMFDFRKSENGYILVRTNEFKEQLIASANAQITKQDISPNQKPSPLGNDKQISTGIYKQGDVDSYNYSRLRKLPENTNQAQKMSDPLYGLSIPKAEATANNQQIPKNAIPVFEDGKMDYFPEKSNENRIKESTRKTTNGKEKKVLIQMGSIEGDTILPPSINYEIPENIYRREIESKTKKK